MAVLNKVDVKQASNGLTTSLAAHLPGATDVRVDDVDIPSGIGFSNETLRFQASWHEDGRTRSEQLVARVQPTGEGVMPTYDLAAEYRLLSALKPTPVPVPRVLLYEQDETLLGAPFLVMDFVPGRVPSDDPSYTKAGWVLDDLTARERARMCDSALATMATIHSVDWQSLDLGFLARADLGERPIDQQIAYYEHYFEWGSEGQPNPTVSAAFDWVRANVPTGPESTVLCWGDARIGNCIFDEALNVAAALDFEMATLASPELDLGWWLFLLRYHTEGIGSVLPPGMPSRDEVKRRYQELTHRRLEHIDFYEVFGGLRLAVIFHRATNMMVRAGLLPSDTPAAYNNAATGPLARLLGLPAPEGVAQDLVAATRSHAQ